MAKNKGGRPNEFKDKYITMTEEYLESCVDVEKEFHKTRGAKSNTYECKIDVNLPTIEGLAIHLDVSKKTISNWEKENEEFLRTTNKIRLEQKKRLLNKGLSGDYNAGIVKLVLSANHGMKESNIHEHTGKDGGAIETVTTDFTKMTLKEREEYRQKLLSGDQE